MENSKCQNKSSWNLEGMTKFEGKKTFQEGRDEIDWKSRGFNFKKIDIINNGMQFLFWKSLCEIVKIFADGFLCHTKDSVDTMFLEK